MANFMDLATELVLVIAFLVPRSADRMRLVLVNRKLYNIIIPELYKHIVLDQKGGPSKRGDFTRKHGKSCWDAARLHHLTSVLKNPALSHKSLIECLDLELDSDTFRGSFERSDIMRYLPSLKSLCLSSKRPAGHNMGPEPYPVSPFVIGRKLRYVCKTLERVTIDIDQNIDFRDGSGVGTLRHFIALKHLSIQSHVFLGIQIDGDQYDRPLFAEILPPGLQKLQIYCLTGGEHGLDYYNWTQVIKLLLWDLMQWGPKTFPELRDVTVYYYADYFSSYELINDLVLRRLEQSLKEAKLEWKKYAFKGQSGKVESVLMEIATREMPKRSVAVRYEPGPQKASRR